MVGGEVSPAPFLVDETPTVAVLIAEQWIDDGNDYI